MNNPMTSRATRVCTFRGLLFIAALLLSGCDGGIFGTGGPDDIDIIASNGADTAVTDTLTDGNDTSSSASEGDAGTSDNGVGLAESDSGATDGIDGASSEGDAASAGDSGGEPNEPAVLPDNPIPESPPAESGGFINSQATLDNAFAQLNIINATSLTINAIETGADAQPLLFNANGIAMNTLSNSATLMENETSLDIIDNNLVTDKLFSFMSFIADDATFSTLLVRENDAQVDVVPLITLTTTQDATLAKIRVIQASSFNNATAEAMIDLQSAGSNPGGVDRAFGPISFVNPETNYIDIPNGDYELMDSLGRVGSQMLNFVGGNVYTIVLIDNSTTQILLINDTEASTQ